MIIIAVEFSFFLMSILVILLPIRWGIWAYIIATNFHLAGLQIAAEGYSFASASSVGVGGAMTVVILPVILIAKAKFSPLRFVNGPKLTKIWVLFTIYAFAMSFISPYFTSAIKMTAYLGWYPLAFALFVYCWRKGYFNRKRLLILFWVLFFIATFQTYALQIFSSGDRFTTFVNVQYFGVYLASFISYLIFLKRGVVENISMIAALAGVFLTGSRYILVGTIFILLVYYFISVLDTSSISSLVQGGVKIAMYSLITVLIVVSIPFLFPESRVNRLVGEAILGGGGYEEIGTLVWRFGMYTEALNEISSRGLLEMIFGSGTSTGAEVGISFRPERYTPNTVDANRIIHNEFIRVMYEWGVIGIGLFAYTIFGAIYYYVSCLKKFDARGVAPFIAISPLMLGSLMIENSLSGAGSIAGVSYMLLASLGYVSIRKKN